MRGTGRPSAALLVEGDFRKIDVLNGNDRTSNPDFVPFS
jgi:hypothetical protein